MKKNIIIVCTVLITVSLTAYGCKNQDSSANEEEACCKPSEHIEDEEQSSKILKFNADFLYNLDSRFIAKITKEKLHNAKSIADLVPKEGTEGLSSFRDVKISELRKEGKRNETGINAKLNKAQKWLLESLDYSDNFYIEANCKYKNEETGEIEDYCFVYYVSIMPEQEAEYKDGQLALIDYLKNGSLEETANTKKELLKPGKVFFTVTQKGEIENVFLESSSGYKSIDKKMIELIKKIPGEWASATNSTGEKVDQELVFSFGIIGC